MKSGKTIVITGVTSGLGRALTDYWINQGHRVFGCGRREDPRVDHEPARYSFRQLDVLDPAALKAWSEEIQAETAIDLLVHNAGVIHPNAELWKIDDAALDAVIEINVKGSFRVLRAFLPTMIERKRGVIVTLSSGAGRFGIAKITGYCASKFAVEGLTKALAEELPAPMAAIPLAPGMIDTAMLRTNFGEEAGNYSDPDDWAARAGPMILGLGREQNGHSLSVPDAS